MTDLYMTPDEIRERADAMTGELTLIMQNAWVGFFHRHYATGNTRALSIVGLGVHMRLACGLAIDAGITPEMMRELLIQTWTDAYASAPKFV